MPFFSSFKVEYHANKNPLKSSEKIAYIGQRLMYNNEKKHLATLIFVKDLTKFLGFYIKNGNKKRFFNKKYIAKIPNPITNQQFLTIKKLTYIQE